MVDTPILDMIFSTPLPSALIRFFSAWSGVTPRLAGVSSSPRAARSRTVSMAR